MKTCTKCGEEKAEAEFHKKSASGDGLQSHCKACDKAARASRYASNTEKVRDQLKAWRAANPGRVKENRKAWVRANQEIVRAKGKAWRKANIERARHLTKAWYLANSERVNIRAAARYEENPGRHRALVKAWFAAHPEATRIYNQNRRARKLAAGGTLSKGLADRLYNQQEGKCACCGEPLTSYHLDHIMPLALGGTNTDDNIQLLLPRCNQSKGAKHPDMYRAQASRGGTLCV